MGEPDLIEILPNTAWEIQKAMNIIKFLKKWTAEVSYCGPIHSGGNPIKRNSHRCKGGNGNASSKVSSTTRANFSHVITTKPADPIVHKTKQRFLPLLLSLSLLLSSFRTPSFLITKPISKCYTICLAAALVKRTVVPTKNAIP